MSNLNIEATLQSSGFLKVSQIIGDKKTCIPPIIPVSRSTWYKGVKDGRFPKGVRVAKRLILWRAKDINEFLCSEPTGK